MNPPKPLGRFQCMSCPYNTDKKYILRVHLRKHSDERPFKCSVCEKAFKCKEYLKEHINNHTDVKPFECVDCDKAFVSSSGLGRHRKLFHSGLKPVKCTECNYSTVDLIRLKRHKVSHMEDRPYKCSHCIYSSTTAVKLKAHMRVHTGEKRYGCDICQRRFGEGKLLRSHREKHFTNGNNEFQCNLCPTKSRSRDNLRRHINRQHNGSIPNKPYKCTHCESAFTLKAYLLRHMEIHDPNSRLNKAKLKLNIRRRKPVRSDGTLVSKHKLINEEVEDKEERLEYVEENADIVEIEEELEIEQQNEEYGEENKDCDNLIRHMKPHDPDTQLHQSKLKLKLSRKKCVEPAGTIITINKTTSLCPDEDVVKEESGYSVEMEEELGIKQENEEFEEENKVCDDLIGHMKTHDLNTQPHEKLKLSHMKCDQLGEKVIKEEVGDKAIEIKQEREEENEYNVKMINEQIKPEELLIKEEKMVFK